MFRPAGGLATQFYYGECIELFSVTLWLELLSAGSKLLSAQSNAVSFAVSA